jgi:hypothetical protein
MPIAHRPYQQCCTEKKKECDENKKAHLYKA